MAGNDRTIAGKAAVVGVGESTYYKHGQAPVSEFQLAVQAILAAAADAGIDARDIDGFASYADDRNDPSRLAAALGCHELRFANMHWGGGGGGVAAAVANAAAAVAVGYADCVVVFRALAQGQFHRFGEALPDKTVSGEAAYMSPHGIMSWAQICGMRQTRFMHEYGVKHDAFRAIAMASYTHAQQNPRAIKQGRPLDADTYDSSRWIVEPINRLFDCCQENDGAAAMIIMAADRARDLPQKPAYVMAAAQGSDHRCGAGVMNTPNLASASFSTVAKRLWQMAGIGPGDVDVVQAYENFTPGVLMSVVEHGFCQPEDANEFFTPENLLAPGGAMPLNTSGGNLAECYMHGLGLQVEAVRQIRGTSCNQVPDAKISLSIGGPMVTPVSSVIYCDQGALS